MLKVDGVVLTIKFPEYFCEGDKKWIAEMLEKLPSHARKRAIEGYSAVYREEYDKEPVCYRKEGKARRAANIRLREFVGRFETVVNERVNTPPKMS